MSALTPTVGMDTNGQTDNENATFTANPFKPGSSVAFDGAEPSFRFDIPHQVPPNLHIEDSGTMEPKVPGAGINGSNLRSAGNVGSSLPHLRALGNDPSVAKSFKELNEKSLASAHEKLSKVMTRDDMREEFRMREMTAQALKREMAADWLPEYRPASIIVPTRTDDTVLDRTTRISPASILTDVPVGRKTKIICTLGPACGTEEGLSSLLDAGMNVARLNFSHGTHATHQEMLDRLRQVASSKGRNLGILLDTKGPEIRTAMLREGKDIELEAGQQVTVVAVADEFTKWEGYKDEATGEIKIGLSYAKLCKSVKQGNIILIADGAISLQVKEILNDTELRAEVVNSHKLGQRKNCNLPGVHVDLPVLAPKDVEDVQLFACKNQLDFIAASFVQTADDVKYIRRVLDEAGGQRIKIIAKVESEAGLRNIDGIVAEADGVMVARGDLAMEVPAEKIALAQKMIIAKCMLAGKFVITATQMLESMIENPLPTRAEMTDVANAVFDGTDAVMLSGETANGAYPALAVATMAKILESAELAVDYGYQYDWIRAQLNSKQGPVSPLEATFAAVSKCAVAYSIDANDDGVMDASEGCLAVVLTKTGYAPTMVGKYRPPCPVIVVSHDAQMLRSLSPRYGQFCCVAPSSTTDVRDLVLLGISKASDRRIRWDQKHVIVVKGTSSPWADEEPQFTVVDPVCSFTRAMSLSRESGPDAPDYRSPFKANCTICVQTLRISSDLIINKTFNHRSTKIIATIGPATWTEEKVTQLLDRGVSILRINMQLVKEADFNQIMAIIDTVTKRRAAPPTGTMYTTCPAVMVSIRGPEIRTTMLRGHQKINLDAGQEVTLVAVDSNMYEGYQDPVTKETRVGVTYKNLCSILEPGDDVLLAEGTVHLKVTKILSDTELLGKVMISTSKKLGEHKLVDIPGKRLNQPFLSAEDKAILQMVARHGGVDFVTLPFVQSAADVELVRQVLDEANAPHIKLVAQIDNPSAILEYDEILDVSDGIMVSRAHLGMRLPSEKVALAQKWMVTRANLACKPVIVAAHLLESMVEAPRPTRAEMTDVANAGYDGADAILLRSETAIGHFPEKAASIASAILQDAEVGVDHYANFNFIRNFTPKPMSTLEAMASSAVKAAIDMCAALMCVVTDTSAAVRALVKYRPKQAIVVATTKKDVAKECNLNYGCVPLLLHSHRMTLEQVRDKVVEFARKQQLAAFVAGDSNSDQLIMMSGPSNRIFATAEELSEMEFVTMVVEGGEEAVDVVSQYGYTGDHTIAYRSTKVGLDLVLQPIASPRKSKIVCTLGPKCWSEQGLAELMDAGMNVARFNFSHGEHSAHQEVLDRLRKVAAEKNIKICTLLDTKGPEVRTAMLQNHEPIELQQGQELTVVAVGDDYIKWEGYKDKTTGETKIGLSYVHLCQDVKPGNRILIADGTIALEVLEILSATELRAACLNTKKLGERKNCNLPGVKIRLPVLTEKDVHDVQKFCCKNQMDFVAASFVQSADDVRFIRKVLDQAGGRYIKIISKIESSHGLTSFDDILHETDGIMVARGDLAMEIPSEKVTLAQKMMITKANIAGKFVITATQMLESMVDNPLPTRAEMTDVANAVFDGTD
eukprot:CAMPEP_0202895824 /NCGR_PEP_ID=MMETSP1392-20130828/4951_1 /ASSEMBLY_ACC=CAM_ASM_000868 /TAXON_ID=225041 /ORGANISM="Chlamydomonas chlamydogama, Strain SAG 11-48b" /LENGTH=1605 /DNA_ID=CAMNT_0049580967 /DNA_START=110 /DNA_END=4924 /DNA_ORIENTATION=+